MVNNKWFLFDDLLSREVCDIIKALGEDSWKEGSVYGDDVDNENLTFVEISEQNNPDANIRVSSVVWVSNQWLYDTVWPYMEAANNNAGWEYDIVSAESMQITKYPKDGFYSWHCDGNGDHPTAYNQPGNKFIHGHVRKLSMSILLNDDYGGGDFQFLLSDRGKQTIRTVELNKAGSIVVFPSYLEHRVSPITEGVRYALVIWFLGPPFK